MKGAFHDKEKTIWYQLKNWEKDYDNMRQVFEASPSNSCLFFIQRFMKLSKFIK